MNVAHNVPLVGQVTDNLCWLAAYQMLEGWFNGKQPKRPVLFTPKQLEKMKTLNWGVKSDKIDAFAQLLGLTVKTAAPSAASVRHLLNTYGPICYPAVNNGYLPRGTHHVVVIRGIKGGVFQVNDPSPVGSGHAIDIPVIDFFRELQPIGNRFLVMLAGTKPNTVAISSDPVLK